MTKCLWRRAAVLSRFCAVFALLLLASSVLAQTVKPQMWTTNRTGTATYPSQQTALAAVHAAGYPMAERVQYVIPGAQVTYVYGSRPRDHEIGPWDTYTGCERSVTTEEAAIACILDIHKSDPGCPAAEITLSTNGPNWGDAGRKTWVSGDDYEQARLYTFRRWKYYPVPKTCDQVVNDTSITRKRFVGCPAGTSWYASYPDLPDYRTCMVGEVARLTTTPILCSQNCGDLQHNPVSVSTGDKVQSETDFSLPWLTFSRHYHSAISAPASTLGPGWTHDLNMRIHYNDTVALSALMPRGEVMPFTFVGNGYEAVDGSSVQLFKITGGGYRMQMPDRQVFFDWLGRAQRIEYVAGDVLTLQYDTYHRLDSVTHSSGRSISFEYAVSTWPHSTSPLLAVKSGGVTLVSYEYDSAGRLEYARYPGGTAKRYHYENGEFPTHLTGISDENNARYATYGYNSDGYATLSEHAGGLYHGTFDYLPDGSTTYTDANGRVQTFGFTTTSAYRKVTGTADSAGSESTTYATDFRRRPLSHVDKRGTRTNYDYYDYYDIPVAADVRRTDTTSAVGTPQARIHRVFRGRYTGYVLKEQRPGQDIVYQRNSRGQVLSTTVTDTATNVTRSSSTTYCEQADITAGTCPLLGLVTSINGPRTDLNDRTTYTYYPSDDATCATSPTTCPHRKGDLWMVLDAVGNITETLKYDGAGRVLSVKDANGVVTDFEYHPRGWLTARKVRGTDNSSEADDQITRIDYYPTGLVQKTTLPDGSFTSYTYDAAHRLTDITDGEGSKIHYTLDNAGNRTKEDTLGATGTVLRTLSRVYNQLGQLQTHKDAYNHATGYVYDANGNTDTVTDALSRVSDNEYDPLNRLTKTIQDVGGLNVTTQFKYDAQDNLTEVIDPKSLSTKYSYNGLGDLKQLDSPDTGVTSYTYDSAGNRQTQTDARGVTATYGYDALNRLTSVSYPDSSLNVSYSYDTAATACASGETFAAGRLSLITDGSGSTQYCYDRFGQMVRKVQTTNGQAFTVRYAYSKAGQLSALTYPDGTVADYVRDALGRTTEVGVTRPGKAREVLLTSVGYYPFGPASEWVFGNGRLFQRTLNQNYQPGVVQDQSPGGLSLGYEFDAVGNLVKLRNGNQSEPPLRRYVYDALNRLTESRDGTTDAVLESYSYDATGNRLSATDNGVTQAYTIASSSHRLMDVGGVGRTYDNAGNTTAIGGSVREFVYSDANRLNAVKQGGVIAMSYAYNGKGEQVRRSNSTDGTITVYDEAGHWLGEYDSAGNPKQQVIWLDDLPVGLVVGLAAANQPLHYIEADALGTPRTIVDSTRNAAVWSWSLTGEAFGKDQVDEDADGDGVDLGFNLRFPGQRYDAASGLNQNGFRDYEAATGRYPQSDPIGLNGGISTYSYVGSSPLTRTDPKGLMWFGPTCSSAQRIAIASQIVQLANEIKEKADSTAKNCTTGDCDWKLAAEVMRWIAHQAYFSCDKQTPCASVWGKGPYVYLYAPYIGAPDASKISSPGQCGCFRSAIFHEAAHVMRYELDEDTIRRKTRGCVSCATNVTESGSPL